MQPGIDIFLHTAHRTWQRSGLQPNHIAARYQHIAYPVRCSGEVENGLALFKSGVGNPRGIITLTMPHLGD
ncbi:hypothetical protein EHW66_09885 [Erwinia psidii]|nr:hypothetical protein [Erwinia psidii]